MATPHCTARPVYIYALCEPDQPWNVRYIGKVTGKNDESPIRAMTRRLNVHLCDVRTRPKPFHRHTWLRSVLDQNKLPVCRLLDIAEESTWERLERFYIKSYKAAGYNLTNATAGGEGTTGYVPTQATRAKLSAASKAASDRVHSPEWRKRVSIAISATKQSRKKTHCIHGHEFTPENIYLDPSGRRRCRICRTNEYRAWHDNQTPEGIEEAWEWVNASVHFDL